MTRKKPRRDWTVYFMTGLVVGAIVTTWLFAIGAVSVRMAR